MSDSFAINAFFISSNIRNVIQEGFGDYTPILLSDVPKLFDSGSLPIDVALIQVTPPDVRGRVSLGISVDIVRSVITSYSIHYTKLYETLRPWKSGFHVSCKEKIEAGSSSVSLTSVYPDRLK